MSCVFCAILRGESTAIVVHRAGGALVVMDVAPSRPGQLVVVAADLAEAAGLLPQCVRALRLAGFARESVQAVTRYDLADPHPHPVLTVLPDAASLEPNPLAAYVPRTHLEADAALLRAAFHQNSLQSGENGVA